jgi:uncharacterized protein YkwD
MHSGIFSTESCRCWLQLEELEPRQLLSGSPPAAVEQLLLERLNDVRADPAAYGRSIGLDLSRVVPTSPLAFQPLLTQVAREHSQDMNDRGYVSHTTPEGQSLLDRLTWGVGFPWTAYGESIAAGRNLADPEVALRSLIQDDGVADLGHRRHLLALDALFQNQNQVGIGIVQQGSGAHRNYYTIDTAAGDEARPILTGVVYNDVNHSARYDNGEGLGGVTITVSGVGSTTTWDSGGYSFPLAPGTYQVTASGGSLANSFTQTVTVGTTNYRLNFTVGPEDYIRHLYQSALGRSAASWEVANWLSVLRGPGGAQAVVNGIERSPEARTRLVGGWYETYLGRSSVNHEEQGWVASLLQGAGEETVLAGILGSAEFLHRAGVVAASGTPQRSYVQALYSLLLARNGSDSEAEAWEPAVMSAGRTEVALAFLRSAEHRSGVVRGYYADLLHRTASPSADEVIPWVESGADFTVIRAGFLESAEFTLNG